MTAQRTRYDLFKHPYELLCFSLKITFLRIGNDSATTSQRDHKKQYFPEELISRKMQFNVNHTKFVIMECMEICQQIYHFFVIYKHLNPQLVKKLLDKKSSSNFNYFCSFFVLLTQRHNLKTNYTPLAIKAFKYSTYLSGFPAHKSSSKLEKELLIWSFDRLIFSLK